MMKRKLLSMLLAATMVTSLLPLSAFAAETATYDDVNGHWAQSSITRWSGYRVVQGYDGEFQPDGNLTRAQMASILCQLLKLPAAASAGFTDVAADAWYADSVNRCAAAGIIFGSEGKAMPEDPITREDSMVMLCRALGLEPVKDVTATDFRDFGEVSAYAQGYIAALVRAGVVKGDNEGLLNPVKDISRAEMVSMLDRLVVHYSCEDGETIDAKDGGLVVIVAKNVKVVNAPEGTKVIVADDATNLKVNGTTVTEDQTYIVPGTSSGTGGGSVVVPSHTHSWGAPVTTKHATKGENGTKTYTCTSCGETKTEDIKWKFYLAATSGSTVDMTVGDDYTAVFTLPEAGSTVNAGSVSLTAKMQDVASLGVNGKKSHNTTINTSLGSTDVTLSTWLPNTYKFDGADIVATIDGKTCTYKVDKITDGQIVATTDTEAARAAWQALIGENGANIKAAENTGNDSKIVIKKGAYLMIGTEKLEFEDGVTDDLILDNFNDMNALNTAIRNHAKLTTCADQGGTITMYLPKGTQLAVGGSIATLQKNCTITIAVDADQLHTLDKDGKGPLAQLRDLSDSSDSTLMAKKMVELLDGVVGVVDHTSETEVNINFA